jgi:hypothetical protein
MIIAMATLMVIVILSAAVLANAISTTTSSTKDRNSKDAVQAAESGAQIAAYRLSKIAASPSSAATFSQDCITDTQVDWITSGNTCPSKTVALGNSATADYWVTPAFTTANEARDTNLASWRTDCNATANWAQRCVIAQATVHGVQRRIQVLVSQGDVFNGIRGIAALKTLTFQSGGTLSGDIGANTGITGGGMTESGGTPPYKCYTSGTNTCPAAVQAPLPSPLTGPVMDTYPFAAAIANDTAANMASCPAWNSATRGLSFGSGQTCTLPAGDYNFCYIDMQNNNGEIRPAAGARVRIFVDSLKRPSNGCSSGAAGTSVGQVHLNSGPNYLDRNRAGQLEIYMYGTNAVPNTPPPPSSCPTDLNDESGTGSSHFYLVAPNSAVNWQSGALPLYGEQLTCSVNFQSNTAFTYEAPATPITSPAAAFARVKGAWRECKASYSSRASDNCSG